MNIFLGKSLRIFIVLSLVSFISIFYLPTAFAAPVSFSVNVTSDASDVNLGDNICETATPGECSLRAAIQESNANANPTELDTITFSIPGVSAHTIAPSSQLPDIIQPVRIDGSTQGSLDCVNNQNLVTLDATNSFYTFLTFASGTDGSSVNGLSFVNANDKGIGVRDISRFTLTCSNFGVASDGVTPGPNAGYGVRFDNASDVNIDDNYFENNGSGIALYGAGSNINITNNQIEKSITFTGIEISQGSKSNVLIEDNVSSNAVGSNPWGAGFAVAEINGLIIRNNVASNNNGVEIGFGIHIANSSNIEISNNITNNNGSLSTLEGSDGILCYTSTDISIHDNLSNFNYGNGISVHDVQRGNLFNNRSLNNGNGILATSSDHLDIYNNVSGNNSAGGINLGDVSDSKVRGNFSGIDSDGLTPLGNGAASLILISNPGESSVNNIIGGTTLADRNYFANSGSGDIVVASFGGDTSNNKIIGNYSGVNINGEIDPNFLNKAPGVIIGGGAKNNILGGTSPQEANVIAGNAAGVFIATFFGLVPSENAILGNSIYSNSSGSTPGLGIDILADTDNDFVPDTDLLVNPNDADDGDVGPNHKLNYPIVSNVESSGDDVSITYSLDVDNAEGPATGYRVEFFANVSANPSGHGDGQLYLGYENISGSVSNHTFTISNTGLPIGTYAFALTATQIDASAPFGFRSTSEYSGVEVAGITQTASVITNPTTVPTTTTAPTGIVSGNTQSSTGAKGTLSATGTNSDQQGIYAISFIFIGLIIVAFAKRRRRNNSHI